ncbi:MAG: FMN-binding protein [bacterium]|nr:FMN-binding protein [bacterium]
MSAPPVLRNAGRVGRLAFLLGVFVAALVPTLASAKVFVSQNQALREAFPDATRIERETKVLVGADFDRIKDLTKDDRPAKVIVLHTAWRDDTVLGYAHIDVHNVRTKPEAFMVVLTPDGIVRSVRVLAFHEPLDYLPTDRWYAQFQGKTREDRMRVGGDIHGVVGATLSAQAASDGVRRMLAYFEVLLKAEPMAAVTEAALVPSADAADEAAPVEP